MLLIGGCLIYKLEELWHTLRRVDLIGRMRERTDFLSMALCAKLARRSFEVLQMILEFFPAVAKAARKPIWACLFVAGNLLILVPSLALLRLQPTLERSLEVLPVVGINTLEAVVRDL